MNGALRSACLKCSPGPNNLAAEYPIPIGQYMLLPREFMRLLRQLFSSFLLPPSIRTRSDFTGPRRSCPPVSLSVFVWTVLCCLYLSVCRDEKQHCSSELNMFLCQIRSWPIIYLYFSANNFFPIHEGFAVTIISCSGKIMYVHFKWHILT